METHEYVNNPLSSSSFSQKNRNFYYCNYKLHIANTHSAYAYMIRKNMAGTKSELKTYVEVHKKSRNLRKKEEAKKAM